jgi:hypothetical protein
MLHLQVQFPRPLAFHQPQASDGSIRMHVCMFSIHASLLWWGLLSSSPTGRLKKLVVIVSFIGVDFAMLDAIDRCRNSLLPFDAFLRSSKNFGYSLTIFSSCNVLLWQSSGPFCFW